MVRAEGHEKVGRVGISSQCELNFGYDTEERLTIQYSYGTTYDYCDTNDTGSEVIWNRERTDNGADLFD